MTAGTHEGLRAIVTGGASGIGAAIAAALRDRGARVAVLDLQPATTTCRSAATSRPTTPSARRCGRRWTRSAVSTCW